MRSMSSQDHACRPWLLFARSAVAVWLFSGGFASAYDCDVHVPRPIRQVAGGPVLRTNSLRDECFRETSPNVADWAICQCNNTGDVISNPAVATCPAGQTELGRCVASQRYYEKVGGFSATVFHAFVPNATVCEPCAHDVVSAVSSCKALCTRYLDGRYFDKKDTRQNGNGSWRIMTDAERANPNLLPVYTLALLDSTHPRAFRLPDPLDGNQLVTPAEFCRRRCGPPNPWNPAGATQWTQPGDHWHYVTYGRWDPNQNLDGWLRSHTVNKDKPDAPAKECEGVGNAYCDAINDLADGLGDVMTTGQVTECKRKRLLRKPELPAGYDRRVDYLKGTFDFTTLPFGAYPAGCNDGNLDLCDCDGNPDCAPDSAKDLFATPGLADDGFCDHLFRGNYLCPQTCYHLGDGGHNPFHKCCHRYDQAEDRCLDGGIVRDDYVISPKCEGPALTFSGGSLIGGGAVCQVPPPAASYYVAKIVSPVKQAVCGAPTVVQVSQVPLAATYYRTASGPSVSKEQVVKAVWRNLSNGATGDLMFVDAYGVWTTTTGQLIPLQSGVNRINVVFTDRALRSSGDVIEITAP